MCRRMTTFNDLSKKAFTLWNDIMEHQPHMIGFIPERSQLSEWAEIAIENDPMNLAHIAHHLRTPELCWKALCSDKPHAYTCFYSIPNPTPEMKAYAYEQFCIERSKCSPDKEIMYYQIAEKWFSDLTK